MLKPGLAPVVDSTRVLVLGSVQVLAKESSMALGVIT